MITPGEPSDSVVIVPSPVMFSGSFPGQGVHGRIPGASRLPSDSSPGIYPLGAKWVIVGAPLRDLDHPRIDKFQAAEEAANLFRTPQVIRDRAALVVQAYRLVMRGHCVGR